MEAMKDMADNQYDLAIFDPPFNIWNSIKKIPKAKNYLCFTNFQNRSFVEKIFGKPKFELIWYFKDGRWVSNNMPRITHENILIYGELKNSAFTGNINTNKKSVKKGKSCIGKDKNLGNRIYTPKEFKMLNSVLEVPRDVKKPLGVWSKPLKLVMPLMKWLVNKNDKVFDGYMGSGTFAICCHDLNVNYTGYEICENNFKIANDRVNAHTAQLRLYE